MEITCNIHADTMYLYRYVVYAWYMRGICVIYTWYVYLHLIWTISKPYLNLIWTHTGRRIAGSEKRGMMSWWVLGVHLFYWPGFSVSKKALFRFILRAMHVSHFQIRVFSSIFASALVRSFVAYGKRLKGNAVKFGNSPAAVNSEIFWTILLPLLVFQANGKAFKKGVSQKTCHVRSVF